MTMPHHVLAVYDTPSQASVAVDRLVQSGVNEDQVSLVMSDGYRSSQMGVEVESRAPEGAATGATVGGVLGALAAGLATTGAVVASGGTVLVAGPIAAALAGAGAGGAAGGVLGGLLGMGVPKHEVKSFKDAIDNNAGMVVGVAVNDGDNAGDIKRILKDAGGKGVSEQ
jgi:predicted phage tail protein